MAACKDRSPGRHTTHWVLAALWLVAGTAFADAGPLPGTDTATDSVAVPAHVVTATEPTPPQRFGSADEQRFQQASLALRAVYEQSLASLPDDKQRHYAQRLWRLTGDPRYLALNRDYGERLLAQLASDAQVVADPATLAARNAELLDDYSEQTAKDRRRKAMLTSRVDMMMPRGVLFRLAQAEYHNLLGHLDAAERQCLFDSLAAVDWRGFLTDPEVLSIYAAQVANQVAFLYQLGIADLRPEVYAAFQALYPPSRIEKLDDAEYRNWLYGLTHVVIAASRYYQQPVTDAQVGWALEALESQEGNMIGAVKEDILAEVALSLQLAGREEHPLVDAIRADLMAARDPAVGIVPSVDGGVDLADGEHRNVLAIMTLGWQGHVTPGPDLGTHFSAPRTTQGRSP